MTRGSKTPKCTCPAYPYPHRVGSGKCQEKPLVREIPEEKNPPYEPDEIDTYKERSGWYD